MALLDVKYIINRILFQWKHTRLSAVHVFDKLIMCMQRGPSSQGRVLKNAPGMEVIHSMGTSESLLSASWEILLSRIGDTLMIYLLLHVDMFVTLKNDCCFQLSGQPIITAARASKKTSEALQSKLTVETDNPMDAGVNGYARAQGDEASKVIASRKQQSKNGERINGMVTQDLSLPTVGSCKMDILPSIGSWSKRSSRPSSWRRKKIKKEMLRKNSPLKMSDDASITPRNAYVTQQFGTDSTNPSGRSSGPELRRKERYGHSQWPKYLCKPSDMVIQRPAIFYGSKYALRAGLPAKRML